MSGLDQNGFSKQTLQDVLSDVGLALKTAFGKVINLAAGSIFATFAGIFSERAASLWDQAQAIYFSQYPDTASGVSLDLAVGLTGITRLPATSSRQLGQRFFGTVGTVIPLGTVLYVVGAPTSQFSTDAAVTLIAGSNEVQMLSLPQVVTSATIANTLNTITVASVTGIAAGQTVTGTGIPAGTTVSSVNTGTGVVTLSAAATASGTLVPVTFNKPPTVGTFTLTLSNQTTTAIAWNAAASAIQAALEALSAIGTGNVTVTGSWVAGFTITFINSAGLQPQVLLVVGNNSLLASGAGVSPVITETSLGVAQASTTLTALATGPTSAPAGSLTQFQTPVAGISRTLNPSDALIGTNIETDAAMKIRRKLSLQISGASTFDAMRSKLLQITGVSAVIVFENDDDVADGSGRPPHCFEAVVQGGAVADIVSTIFKTKPTGIPSYGNSSSTYVDTQGVTRTVYYSTPTVVPIYVTVTLTTNSLFPVNGHTLAVQAILNYVNGLGIGNSVIVAPAMYAALSAVPGITNAVILVGIAPNPTLGNNISLLQNQVPSTQTTQIAVSP